MNLEQIKKQLEIRYSKDLYLGFNRSSLYHFLYAYKRFVIEIVRSFYWVLKSFVKSKRDTNNESVALFSTLNQKKALLKAKELGVYNGDVLQLNLLSKSFCFKRLLVWIAKACTYPFLFFQSNCKQGLYFTSLTVLMVWYNKVLKERLLTNTVENLYISNDHAGDIFILSILLRDVTEQISVSYVQHGAVKAEFPINYFDKVYVYDEIYKNVYKRLCKSEAITIEVLQNLNSKSPTDNLPQIDFIVCLSHQFPAAEIIRGLKILKTHSESSISIRFHPSDRLKVLKFFIFKLFIGKVCISNSSNHYRQDFDRANRVFCASSSLILDAYNDGLGDKVVWVKPFGLNWDYYGLEKLLVVAHKVCDLKTIVKNNAF